MIPLQYLGVSDLDLQKLSLDDQMKYAMANIEDREGGYVVRHGLKAISEFGRRREGYSDPRFNPLAAAFPILFPYGIGGIEEQRKRTIGFTEHVRWALQYHDRRFRTHHSFPFVCFGIEQKREAMISARVQMHRRDFERDALAISTLTVADLKQAEKEEAAREPISNPRVKLLRNHVFATAGRVKGSDRVRALYRGQIWGTCLKLGGPSLWTTINPSDIHDPVVQIFAGEEIDMDNFMKTLGPDSNRRAANVARDPYAASKYFFFIIDAVLRTLFGITITKDQVHTTMGLLGRIASYFGVVEAQGRGSLHVHMLIWLDDTPNCNDMQSLLQSNAAFRSRIQEYIRENIRAHVDGLDEETMKNMGRESQLAYSRPPDPDSENWENEYSDRLQQVVCSQQVHTCSKASCLRYNKYGRLICKRHAPWELSDTEVIDAGGRWKARRTVPFINNFCPSISVTLCCNNDIKLITNGADTKDAMWYSTMYQSKKQCKNHNISALMAQSFLYHETHKNTSETIIEQNRLLIFRCQHAINREMEMSGPQVVAYLMGWGDCICSHRYVPLYWSSVQSRLLSVFEGLRTNKKRGM